MSIKKVFLANFLILTLIFISLAEKKHPPVPLQKLQNPKSSSYVPIPYPQTREEIIVDLKHVIKKQYVPKKGLRSFNYLSSKRLLYKLLEKKPELYVGKIVTANNRTFLRAEKYFIIDIHNLSGIIIARFALEDSGLFAGAGFASDAFKINPLISSIPEVKAIFAKSRISTLANAEIESIEYECFSSGPVNPFLKIKSTAGIFYMNTRYDVYKFMKKKQFSSDKELMEFKTEMFEKYTIHRIKKPFDGALRDSITNEVIFLEKIDF